MENEFLDPLLIVLPGWPGYALAMLGTVVRILGDHFADKTARWAAAHPNADPADIARAEGIWRLHMLNKYVGTIAIVVGGILAFYLIFSGRSMS